MMEAIYQNLYNKAFPILVLLGTTTSGKTEISLALAEKLDAEIISSDSIQAYRRLDIGSAKPSRAQLQSVKHHLIDILDAQEFYSAGKFLNFAKYALDKIYSKKKIPILICGNMFYVRCLIEGMVNIPEVTLAAKQKVAALHKKGLEFCYQELIKLDVLAKNKIIANDTYRIIRALEVFLSHQKSIFIFHKMHHLTKNKYSPLYLGIDIEKTVINERINQRISQMLKMGFLDEVETLIQDYSAKAPALQAIGYKQAVEFLQGKLTKQKMIEQIQQKTRQYAKRQRTWYKKFPSAYWVKNFF